MVERLSRGPASVSELAEPLTMSLPAVVQHLQVLEASGLVRSEKGRGGGWTVARPLRTITLREVYDALGEPELLAIGNRAEAPQCLVERAVNSALGAVFDEAEAVLLKGLGAVTLADLSADFHAGLRAHRTGKEHDHGR